MKILLVYCNSMLENALPIGLTSLSACLKQAGHHVELFDTTFYKWGEKSDTENRIDALQIMPCPLKYIDGNMLDDLEKRIKDMQPDIVGLSVVEPTYDLAIKILQGIQSYKERTDFAVAVGGVHAMIAPHTFTDPSLGIDYICISEGEFAFVELCGKIERGVDCSDQIGHWVFGDSGWKKNKRAPLVDINSIPFLDFDLFPDSYLNKPMLGRLHRTIVIETSRGCPYHCSYCCDHTLKELFKDEGHWYRIKSIERIDAELEYYTSKYEPEFIYVMSESFLAGSYERVRPVLDIFKKYKIPFWFNTRPEDVTTEKIRLAKEAGLVRASIGVESGSEDFRRSVLKRNLTNEKMIEAARILNDEQISFSANLIIGFPLETREMIFEGISLCKAIKASAISTHIFNPYHGTRMRDIAIENGFIAEDMIASDFFQEYALKGNTLSDADIYGLFRTIPLYVDLPEDRYQEIEKAEILDEVGNGCWDELRKEYYELKGW